MLPPALLGYHLPSSWNVSPARAVINAPRMIPHIYSRRSARLCATRLPRAPPSCALATVSTCNSPPAAFLATCTCPVHTLVRPESQQVRVPRSNLEARMDGSWWTRTPAPSPRLGDSEAAIPCLPVPPPTPRGSTLQFPPATVP